MKKILKNFLTGRYGSFRHFYLASSLLAIVIVVFSLTFLINDYFDFKQNIARDIKWQNERIKQKMNDSLLYTRHLMRYIGKQVANHGEHDYKFIANLLASYRTPEDGIMSWSTFSWVDKNYMLVVSSNIGIMNNPADMSKRDYIPLTEKFPENVYFGAQVFGAVSKLWSVPLGYGVVNTHREYIGSVITGIVIENLRMQIENMITNRDVLFAILDSQNRIITSSSALELQDNKNLFDKFLRKLAKENPDKILYKNCFYQKLDDYPYSIVTIYDSKAFGVGENDRLIIYLIAVSMIIAVTGFIFYGFHRNLVSPIIQISALAEKIYRDDPYRKVPKFEVAEIDNLAKSLHKIDQMLSQERKANKNSNRFPNND